MNILITGARAPISADLARVLAAAGQSVWLTDSLRWPIGRFSTHIQGYFQAPPPVGQFEAFSQAMANLVAAHGIECIIPTSEEVFWLAQVPALQPLLFAPPFEVLDALHNKAQFAHFAQRMGYGAAQNFVLRSRDDARAFVHEHGTQDFVFKPVYSRFGTSVHVGPLPPVVLNLDFSRPWLAQTRIKGQEICLYNVARQGQLLLHRAYLPRYRAGQGASIYFEPFYDEKLLAMCEQIIAALELSGQISFDVIQGECGPVLLECNPRGTSGVHLAAQQPEAFARALLGESVCADHLARQPSVLGLPFFMYHGHQLWRDEVREDLARAQDAMRAAGVPRWAPVVSTAEVLGRACRLMCNPLAACTRDIEWNGKTDAVDA